MYSNVCDNVYRYSYTNCYMEHTEPYMTAAEAQEIAESLYSGRMDLMGVPEIEHLAYIAAHVPEDCEVLAWLHDIVEDDILTLKVLVETHNLSPTDYGGLILLTRSPAHGTYRNYINMLSIALGVQGTRARIVKSIDLNHNRIRVCPPERAAMRAPAGRYSKAQRIIRSAQLGFGEVVTGLTDREIAELSGINPLAFPA